MRPELRSAHHSGFTLFEVLAAALILVLVGTVAIGSMNADLGRMGDARRRLEAGRLADRALADLEAQLVGGAVPEIQDEEQELDGFVLRRLVAPFDLLFAESQAPRAAVPGAEDAPTEFLPFVTQEFPDLAQHMRVLEVQVEWGNELAPEMVRRTTVAFDQQAALEAVRNAGQNPADLPTQTEDEP